jgi:hypothetical protein
MNNNLIIPEQLENKNIYLIFKCTYLEDGEYPEYSLDTAYFNKDIANIMIKKDNSFLSIYNKIVPHIITKDQDKNKENTLFWNSEYNCWTDKGAFMSVTIDDIINKLTTELVV